MSTGLGTAIAGVLITIFCIALFVVIVPNAYNQNLKAEQKHGSYCMELQKNIESDKQDPDLQNLTIQEINTYDQHCSP